MTNVLEATETLIAAIEAARRRLPDSDAGAAAERNLIAMCQNAIRRLYQQRDGIERRQRERARARAAQAARDADTRSYEEKLAAYIAGLDPEMRARWDRLQEEHSKRGTFKDDAPDEVLARLKAELFKAHPDHGGSSAAFREAFKRYDAARKASAR